MSPGLRLGLSALRLRQWIARIKVDALARDSILEQFSNSCAIPQCDLGDGRAMGCCGTACADWNQSKTSSENNGLEKRFDHGRVLFVQHLPKNALNVAIPGGSFVACAESFGNCGPATEGGIPKSSRFRSIA